MNDLFLLKAALEEEWGMKLNAILLLLYWSSSSSSMSATFFSDG
jgi:hypothetical protein